MSTRSNVRAVRSLPSADMPDMTAAIEVVPVACLVVDQDGAAVAANQAWAALSGIPVDDALRDGWLQAIDALDRMALRALVQDAAVGGIDGSGYFRIAVPGAEQWSRWAWGPLPPRRLIVTVMGVADAMPGDGSKQPATAVEVANMVAHRLFGVGLLMQSAAAGADPRGRSRIEEAIGEIDSVIRDVRALLFRDRPSGDSLGVR